MFSSGYIIRQGSASQTGGRVLVYACRVKRFDLNLCLPLADVCERVLCRVV